MPTLKKRWGRKFILRKTLQSVGWSCVVCNGRINKGDVYYSPLNQGRLRYCLHCMGYA